MSRGYSYSHALVLGAPSLVCHRQAPLDKSRHTQSLRHTVSMTPRRLAMKLLSSVLVRVQYEHESFHVPPRTSQGPFTWYEYGTVRIRRRRISAPQMRAPRRGTCRTWKACVELRRCRYTCVNLFRLEYIEIERSLSPKSDTR